jgi:hypothetical protein
MKPFPGLDLSRKLKFLSLENLGDVEVEEVAVEDSLECFKTFFICPVM